MRIDTLIVGQGLAGSQLAWELLARGERVLVVDRDEPFTSSKVAAGIVTPVTGQRLVTTWRFPEFWETAGAFYRRIEAETGARFFHPTPIARLLANPTEAGRWETRMNAETSGYPPHTAGLDIDSGLFRNDHGGFEMPEAGWLDTRVFLEATRQHLLERAAYAIADLHAEEVAVAGDAVRWKSIIANRAVFCTGWEGNRNRFFDWVAFRNARGQILDLECDALAVSGERRILNRAGWLLPLGNGQARAGATYEWDFDEARATEPDRAGRSEVEARVTAMFVPDTGFRVTGHRAAVRPIIRESRAVVGVHPAAELHGRIAFFNGLGSKGVLNGPFFASQLAGHLVRHEPIDEEVDLRRNR